MKKLNVLILFLGAVMTLIFSPTFAEAESFTREHTADIYLYIQPISGDTTSGDVPGFDLEWKLDDTDVFGIGYGACFHEHFGVNSNLFFGIQDTFLLDKRSGDVINKSDHLLMGWDVNIDAYLLKSRLTPMVTGGIGFMVISGSWDLGGSYSETNFSYNIGAGARWDATDRLLIKAIYKCTWTKLEDTDSAVLFDGINLKVGYRF